MFSRNFLPTDRERQLHDAWTALNKSFAESRVSLTIQHRLTACVKDVLTFCGLVRTLNDDAVRDFESWPESALSVELEATRQEQRPATIEEFLQITETFYSERREEVRAEMTKLMAFMREHGDEHAVRGQRYASAFKALFVFIRALQDASYAVLLEAQGQRAGNYSSMNKGLKSRSVQENLAAELPGYEQWFVEFRRVRDKMKLGIQTGTTYSRPGPKEVTLSLHRVIEKPPQTVIDGRVGVAELDRALDESTRLLKFLAGRLCRPMPAARPE
jgi:hypothetical protein